MSVARIEHRNPALTRPDAEPARYRVQVIGDLPSFQALKAQWDAFLHESGVENLCLTHAWLSTWLQTFPPDELLIMVVMDADGRWAGLAPLKISRSTAGLTHRLLRHLQFIGTHPTVYDWMKFPVHPDADAAKVIQAMADALQSHRWDVLDLQFTSDAEQADVLRRALSLPENAMTAAMPIPYAELPATEAEYDRTRRKKTRHEVNRHRNRFAREFEEPLALAFQPAGEATGEALDRFIEGHIQYWAGRGCKSDFRRFPGLSDFYGQMLAQAEKRPSEDAPHLLFSVLKLGGTELSYHLGFWQGSSYLSHITCFNQDYKTHSPGTVHMDSLIFETIRRGGRLFEFGRGDEPYKKMWARDKKSLWSLHACRSSWVAGLWQIDILLKRLLGKVVA